MPYVGKRVSVGDTPTKIADGDEGAEAIIRNSDEAEVVDLGGSDVAFGSGFELGAGSSATVPLRGRDDDLYGVADAAASVDVHVLVLV